jgi:hypothetical protein
MQAHGTQQRNVLQLGAPLQQVLDNHWYGDPAVSLRMGAAFNPIRKGDNDLLIGPAQFLQGRKPVRLLKRLAGGFGGIYLGRVGIGLSISNHRSRIRQLDRHMDITVIKRYLLHVFSPFVLLHAGLAA